MAAGFQLGLCFFLLVGIFTVVFSMNIIADEDGKFFEGSRSQREAKGDTGPNIQRKRNRRDTRQQPITTAGIGQSMVQPNYQASYFVGQCYMCPPGPPGPRGAPGGQGLPGRDGRDAVLVTSQGTTTVEQQPPPNSYPQQNGNNQTDRGVTYIRWGRPDCPTSAQLIYQGVAAGSHYEAKGGGANHLCLPSTNPVFDRPVAGAQGSQIHGAEYQVNTNFPNLPNLYDNAVPCALCFAPGKIHTLMVPGRNVCPEGQGWTKEYHGYVLADHHTHNKAEYLCFDHQSEGIPRTTGNQNEALFYVVEVACSTSTGIPCPPYVNGYELTCAVCTI